MSDRKAKPPARSVYAAQPMDTCDAFYVALTSFPYVQMLIERQPQPDGRFCLFVGKH